MITKLVSDIIKRAEDPVVLTSGDEQRDLEFDYFKTLKRIDCYVNNKYLDRDDGIFWNISNTRITHFAKNIDLDTKDLMPYGIGETNYYQAWIVKMLFRQDLDDNHWALKLNELSDGVSTYGSWVWEIKKSDGDTVTESVQLHTLYFDQTVKSIRDTNVVRKHYLTPDQLGDKEEVWEGVSYVLDKSDGEDYIEVWEFVGEYDDEYQRIIGWGYGDDYQELYQEDLKESPYYDFHVGEWHGRWLRVGVVERLFDLQVRINELVHYNREASAISTLLLMRSNDPNMEGNVLRDVESGDIINSQDLQQVAIQNPALNQFVLELREIEAKADQLCLTPQVITGEQLPSGVPFRSTAVFTNAAKSAFKITRENLGEVIETVIIKHILPGLRSKWNKGMMFEVSGDLEDLKFYDEAVVTMKVAEKIQDSINKGEFLGDQELETLRQMVLDEIDRKGRKIDIPKKWFKFEFGLKFNITGEKIDKTQLNNAYDSVLQMIQVNPAIQNSPYFRQYCELNGITPIRMSFREQQEMAQMGGGAMQPIGGKEDKLLAQVDSQ